MRRVYWTLGLTLAGLFLAVKEVDWVYDSMLHKLAILGLYAALGAITGFCLSIATQRSASNGKSVGRLMAWIAAFALMGLGIGHGNVSWPFTLRVMAVTTAVGAFIGILQFFCFQPHTRG
jgi:hypothetical protein